MFNYDKLDKAIRDSGKTRTYLCQKLGRPPYYLRDVLRQKNNIPLEYQKILADECGVTVEYLNDISDKNEKTASPTTDGLSEYDIKALAWFHSLSPEKRKAILSLADGPEELAELPDCE